MIAHLLGCPWLLCGLAMVGNVGKRMGKDLELRRELHLEPLNWLRAVEPDGISLSIRGV